MESNFEISEPGLGDGVCGLETSWEVTGSPAPFPLLSSATDSKLAAPVLFHTPCLGPSPTCGLTLTSTNRSCVGQSALPEEAGLNIAA